MTDTDGMTLDELKVFLDAVDSTEQLDALGAMEADGQDRKGAHELIAARRAEIEEGPTSYPVYRGDVLIKGTHCVAGRRSGEVTFTVEVAGEYQPQDEAEQEALELLGAKPGRE